MNTVLKSILTIAAILAVLGFTVFNYLNGKISLTYFMVYVAILVLPMVNIVNLLIQELKKK